MPDWKAMYLSLMRDTEKAIRILEEGQRKCEELYLQDEGPHLQILPRPHSGISAQDPPARSEAERAEREAGQMRPSIPAQDAPPPRDGSPKARRKP